VAPGIVAGALVVGLIISGVAWLLGHFRAEALVEGAYAYMLVVIAAAIMAGVALGNIGPKGDLVIGQFLATRPLTCSELASTILRAAALSLALAWAVWAAAWLAAFGLGHALSDRPLALVPRDQDWRYILLAVVASWITTGVISSATLTGHSRPLGQLFIVTVFGWIAFVFFAKYALEPSVAEQAHRAVALLASFACLAGTLWAFVAARRRGLINASLAWAALAAWAALVVAAAMLARSEAVSVPGYVALVSILALAVLPLAAAPLALAWNRHR
jgi:hypothetical protein